MLIEYTSKYRWNTPNHQESINEISFYRRSNDYTLYSCVMYGFMLMQRLYNTLIINLIRKWEKKEYIK